MRSMEKRNHGSKHMASPPARAEWLLLAYRIPREPSTPRISVWRKLRQLGAAQIGDGLVALPTRNSTREQFAWLAQEIREAHGEAWLWESQLADRVQERALVASMEEEIAGEYRDLAKKAREAAREPAVAQGRALSRCRREFRRIEAKDYFGIVARSDAVDALERLSSRVTEATR